MLQKLGGALGIVRQWEQIMGTDSGAWEAAPGSDLEGDDGLSDPIQVSSAAWTAVTAAVSHLGTLRDSLFHHVGQDEVKAWVHIYGQPALIRCAIENASRALWLLQPEQREERILRRLRADYEERRQLVAVAHELGSSLKGGDMKSYEDRMKPVLIKAGVSLSKLRRSPSYGDIVKEAGALTPVGAKTALVIWKACSALAHGELRGTIAYLSHLSQGAAKSGMALSQVTASVELLTTGGLLAISTTRLALDTYAKRSGTSMAV
ncbi:hypothetical protein Cs7R123_55640 [Catellatospora sp. TT07R-123]|uniref:hypothetical protein n=1 Tax=Catellatospora sp. TT07R-123 TaxID=2733863 RepID=UPI001B1F1D70|nr:hypothetical protein [Catellatospora sp. TT07R-123]GHJ48222.1 hypothetical protein Cs7R123_55640 [Catellatospora sp. TT07R-123]